MHVSRYTLPLNIVTRFIAVLFVTMIKIVVMCVQDTRFAEWLSLDRMINDYTHDETSDMMLTFGACNSRDGIAARVYALCYPG